MGEIVTLRDLFAPATKAVGETWAGVRMRHRRYALRARLSWFHSSRDYFENQVRNGLAGSAYCDKQIALLESELRKIKN